MQNPCRQIIPHSAFRIPNSFVAPPVATGGQFANQTYAINKPSVPARYKAPLYRAILTNRFFQRRSRDATNSTRIIQLIYKKASIPAIYDAPLQKGICYIMLSKGAPDGTSRSHVSNIVIITIYIVTYKFPIVNYTYFNTPKIAYPCGFRGVLIF